MNVHVYPNDNVFMLT